MDEEWKTYRKNAVVEMRPLIEGEDISNMGVNPNDDLTGAMVARDPSNHKDNWIVSKDNFEANYEEVV